MARVAALVVVGLLVGALGAGGVTAYLQDDEMVVTLAVDPELDEERVDPGESVVVDVELTVHGDFGDVPMALSADGTTVVNETVDVEETDSMELSWETPEEPAIVDVDLEVHVQNRTFVEPVGQVVIGEPVVDDLAIAVPSWLPAGDVRDYVTTDTGIEATVDGETVPVEELATISANGTEIDRVADWPSVDHGETVTLEASFLGETTTATVPVVDDPAALEMHITDDRLYAGAETTITIGPAENEEPAPEPRNIRSTNESIATVDYPTITGHLPGEVNVTIQPSPPFGDSYEWPITVEPSPVELTIEPGTDELAVGETTTVGVHATTVAGDTEEVTFPAELTIENETVLGYDDGQLVGLEPGETELLADYEWRTTNVTIVVEPAEDGLPGPGILLVATCVVLGSALATVSRRTHEGRG